MNFKCVNCGGNMVWSPEKNAMFCPFCDGIDCESVAGDKSLTVCSSCGGELTIDEYTSASRCPYCDNYLIFDERVSDRYKPDEIIPFKISKQQAVEAMENEFKKRTFAPVSFLHEKTLEKMGGYYVPFFLYDYEADSEYEGVGTHVRCWRSGDYDYTETSYYEIKRRMHASYDNIPVDASIQMEDGDMDLMEPFDYKEFCSFDPKYMSGFFGEVYNNTADAFEERAKDKAAKSASQIMHESITGYSSLRSTVDKTELTHGKTDFALFPIWLYVYNYSGKSYRIFVNGQTGKVVGKTPISMPKVITYGLTVGGFVFGMIQFILRILEVL